MNRYWGHKATTSIFMIRSKSWSSAWHKETLNGSESENDCKKRENSILLKRISSLFFHDGDLKRWSCMNGELWGWMMAGKRIIMLLGAEISAKCFFYSPLSEARGRRITISRAKRSKDDDHGDEEEEVERCKEGQQNISQGKIYWPWIQNESSCYLGMFWRCSLYGDGMKIFLSCSYFMCVMAWKWGPKGHFDAEAAEVNFLIIFSIWKMIILTWKKDSISVRSKG